MNILGLGHFFFALAAIVAGAVVVFRRSGDLLSKLALQRISAHDGPKYNAPVF